MTDFKLSNKPYVIKETKDVYFVYKPDGYISDHSYNVIKDTKGKSVINYIRNELTIDEDLKTGKYKFGQINRLDYGTNGTIIVARNIKSYEKIQEYLQTKKTKKIYIALVEGKVEKQHDYITIYMKKIYQGNDYKISYDLEDKSGEPTLSEYMLWKHLYDKQEDKYYSLVLIRIYTGMTHQIRVHMKSIGHSLINDFHYGIINKRINDGKMFLISYLYCIKEYGCSINYKKEPDIKFDNLIQVYEKMYTEIINYLIKQNNDRKQKLKQFKKVVRKQNKKLTYYVIKKDMYTLVNIPSGKISHVDQNIKDKLTCLVDNKLHTVGLIDTNIEYNYVYYFLVRWHVKKFQNEYFDLIPYKYIELETKEKDKSGNNKVYKFSQIFIKLNKSFDSFDQLVQTLNENNVILVYDKTQFKLEIEFQTFRHYHNYALPIVDNKIIKKFWVNNLEKNKYKYDMNLNFKKVNKLKMIF
jgi:23S rRNA pseudouridine1911/1915/1917 synthase